MIVNCNTDVTSESSVTYANNLVYIYLIICDYIEAK